MNTTHSYTAFWPPLIAFLAGIYFQRFLQVRCIFLGIATIACLVLFLLLQYIKRPYRHVALVPLFLFSGSLLLQLHTDKQCIMQQKFCGKKLDLIATVSKKECIEHVRFRQQLLLKVQQIKEKNSPNYEPCNFKLLCYSKKTTHLAVDDQIILQNITFSAPQSHATLSGNPTFADYLLKEHVVGTMFTNNLHPSEVSRPYWSLWRWLAQKREHIYNAITAKLKPTTLLLFNPIFLGKKNQTTLQEVKRHFNRWGIVHFLARSGLHVILFIVIWKFMLSFLPLNLFIRQILLLFLCITYGALTWPSISFWRAFYVFLFYELGKLLERPAIFLHLLTLTCLAFALFNPMQALFLDFQLTFGLTFAFSLFQAKIFASKK